MSQGAPAGFVPASTINGTPSFPYIIDTSVAFKWYVPESDSAEAQQYLRVGLERHAPDLLPLEGTHALLKRVRSTNPVLRLTARDAERIATEFRDSPLIKYHSCIPLLEPGMVLAIEIGASVYDGLFLALAIEKKGRVVTADRPFHDKIVASSHSSFVRWFMDAP